MVWWRHNDVSHCYYNIIASKITSLRKEVVNQIVTWWYWAISKFSVFHRGLLWLHQRPQNVIYAIFYQSNASLKGNSANLILHYIERFGSRLKICKKLFLKILCRSRDTKCHTSSWASDVIAREPINIKSCVGASLYWFTCDDIRGPGRCVTPSISAFTQYFQKQFFTYF